IGRAYAGARASLLQRPRSLLHHRGRDLSLAGPGAADGIHALPVLRDGGAGGSRAAEGHVQLAAGEPIGHILLSRSVISIDGPACDEEALTMNPQITAILIGVRDLKRSKQFYSEGLGCPIDKDFPAFVSFNLGDGSSALALYEWDALAGDAGVAKEGSGFRGFSLHYIVSCTQWVDEV